MKRSILAAIVKLFGQAALLAMVGALVVAGIGWLNHWETALQYGDALFIAGGLLIIGGAASKLASSQESPTFQWLGTESLRALSDSQQASYVETLSSSVRVIVVAVLGGILLMLVSELVSR